jgi:hypothetical protein
LIIFMLLVADSKSKSNMGQGLRAEMLKPERPRLKVVGLPPPSLSPY